MFYITDSELTQHLVFSCDSKSTETRCYIYPTMIWNLHYILEFWYILVEL